MLIKINDFENGIHEFELIEEVEKLELDSRFFDKVKCRIKMDKSFSQIVLFCEISSLLHLTCDRCTVDFDAELINDFVITYLFSSNEDKESEDESVYFIKPEQDKINIRKDVIEFVNLSIPMKILCEDDCKGLCPKCGNNLNKETCNCNTEEIDPKWLPLMKLKDKLN